jgi:hypothetical protein
MYNNIRLFVLTCLTLAIPTFAIAYAWLPAYTFKVYTNDELFWEGNFKEEGRTAMKVLGMPESPKCRNKMVPEDILSVFCRPVLRIVRNEEADAANCDGFLLIEEYVDHWDKSYLSGNTLMVPAKISHNMCIGTGDSINFTSKTSDGWLKQTTYRIEMSKVISKE